MSECTSQGGTATNTIGQIVRDFGDSFIQQYSPSKRVQKVLSNIGRCRTATLGGHKVSCIICGYENIVYNSCGDGSCPQCQQIKKELWVDKIANTLLPVRHYHVIFTVPHELNDLFYYNQSKFYKILFRTCWETISQVSGEGKCGMIATLHSWGSNLSYHPHIHCIVADGNLKDGKWEHGKRKNGRFFVDYSELRACFKKQFLKNAIALLEEDETLYYDGDLINVDSLQKIGHLIKETHRKRCWTVRVEDPVYGVDKLVEYLGRYIRRVAISNSRIEEVNSKEVCFNYKQYSKQEPGKPAPKVAMRMTGERFLQRFSQHILPANFHRVRYYGVYCYSSKASLKQARQSLNGAEAPPYEIPSAKKIIQKMLGIDPDQCPFCSCYNTLVTKMISERPTRHNNLLEDWVVPSVHLKQRNHIAVL